MLGVGNMPNSRKKWTEDLARTRAASFNLAIDREISLPARIRRLALRNRTRSSALPAATYKNLMGPAF